MLTGKVAVVTGAGNGMGRGIALALARQGAAVAVADIDGTLAENAAAEIRAGGGEAMGVKVDVASPAEVEELAGAVVSRFGRLDILVNNAGILSKGPTIDIPREQWQRVLDVNLTGVLLCSQAAARVMIPQGGGRIVNIASTSGHVVAPQAAAYCVSKSGVLALTRVMAVEWAPHNVLVNSVSPGSISETGQATRAREQNPEGFARRDRRIPVQRPARIADIANTVIFLVSEESGFINGRDIVVDGGVLCLDPGSVV